MKAADDIKKQREKCAEQDAGCEWKIEGGMFSLPDKVSRQASERQIQSLRKQHADAGDHNHSAKGDQDSSESVHLFQCRTCCRTGLGGLSENLVMQ